MSAKTIDDVLRELNEIIDGAVRSGDRLGYFAALHARVTGIVVQFEPHPVASPRCHVSPGEGKS